MRFALPSVVEGVALSIATHLELLGFARLVCSVGADLRNAARKEGPPPMPDEIKASVGDRLVALDRDEAELCSQLCRANLAWWSVEIGASYWV